MDGASRGMEDVLAELKERSQKNLSTDSRKPDIKVYDCEICEDTKLVIRREENGVPIYKQCSCIEQKRIERLFHSSEISESFRSTSFRDFELETKPDIIKEAYDLCIQYYREFMGIRHDRVNSLMLNGQPGSGKTHLMTALSNSFMSKKQVAVHYFPYVEGFNDLKDNFDLLERKIDRMKHADILFIDDLFKPAKGEPRATPFQMEQMYGVINYRYLNHKPVLVSTELNLDELVSLDEALGTRLIEMSKQRGRDKDKRDYQLTITGNPKELNHRVQGLF